MQGIIPLILLLFYATRVDAAPSVLYDASSGSTPAQQSWLGLGNGSFSVPVHNGVGTVIDTTNDSDIQFGYFSEDPLFGSSQHPGIPTLSRQDSFEINFTLQVVDENHAMRDDNGDGKNDRAGFSIIVVSDDLSALELGFFEHKVWAYEDGQGNANDLFTQAENVNIDTTAIIHYRLRAHASGYTLYANGVTVLSGDWRVYSASPIFPYDNPSSLFFGDDTTSAAARVVLGDINIETGPFPEITPVPIPPVALLVFAGVILLRVGQPQTSDY